MGRTCSRCGKVKPASEFWRQASRRDGLQAACIECMSASHKRWKRDLPAKRVQLLTVDKVIAMERSRERDPLQQLYRSIKSRAKKEGREFRLQITDVVIPEVCPILGIPLVFGHRRGRGLKERDQRPSVDRIDNTRGYTPDNIIVVSYRANRLKSDATIPELMAVAKFYAGLDHGEAGGSRDTGEVKLSRPVSDHVSAMQPHQKKEAGSMPQRHDRREGVRVLLPSLRA